MDRKDAKCLNKDIRLMYSRGQLSLRALAGSFVRVFTDCDVEVLARLHWSRIIIVGCLTNHSQGTNSGPEIPD